MSEADGGWLVQASFKSSTGALLNLRGATPAEVAELIDAARGQEHFSEFFPQGAGTAVAPPPVLSVVPESDAEAIQRAESILQQQSQPVGAPTGQFDICEYCNIPKDQWKPPGVSKAGKKYPGFFGCPNWKSHP